jgi:hypothetical protein
MADYVAFVFPRRAARYVTAELNANIISIDIVFGSGTATYSTVNVGRLLAILEVES